jgi:hypothetical protein
MIPLVECPFVSHNDSPIGQISSSKRRTVLAAGGALGGSAGCLGAGDGEQSPSAVENAAGGGPRQRGETATLKGDTMAPRMNDSVVAPGLPDPVYPVSEHADLAAAMNAALQDMLSELDYAVPLYLPFGGTYKVNSGKVTIPTFGPDQKFSFRGPPVIEGGGAWKATDIRLTSDFPDDVFLETAAGDRQGDTKPANNAGLRIRGFRIFDPDGALSKAIIDLPDRPQVLLENLFLRTDGADRYLSIPHSRPDGGGSGDFVTVRNVHFQVIDPGQTGFVCNGNQVWAHSLRVGGRDGGGVGCDIRAGAVVLHADYEGLEVGTRLHHGVEESDLKPSDYPVEGQLGDAQQRGSVIFQRTERPGQGVVTPVDVRGFQGARIFPLNAPNKAVRHSRDGGIDTEWVLGSRQTQLEFGGGGPSLPPGVASQGTVQPAAGRIELQGDARLDNGGTPVTGPFSPWRTAPIFSAHVTPPKDDEGTPVGQTRIGLVEDGWSDWVGVELAGTGSAYTLKAVQNGDEVGSVQSNVWATTVSDVVKVAIGGGEATVAVSAVGRGNNRSAAWETFELPSEFGTLETVFDVRDAGSGRTLDVYDAQLRSGRPDSGR